jgi:hypothetical protein
MQRLRQPPGGAGLSAWPERKAPAKRGLPGRHCGRNAAVFRTNSIRSSAIGSVFEMSQQSNFRNRALVFDPPPLKWSDLRHVFDIKEDCNGKEAIQT